MRWNSSFIIQNSSLNRAHRTAGFAMKGVLDLDGLTPALLQRYDRPGPRYTSYPTAPLFTDAFDQDAYCERLRLASAAGGRTALDVRPSAVLPRTLHLLRLQRGDLTPSRPGRGLSRHPGARARSSRPGPRYHGAASTSSTGAAAHRPFSRPSSANASLPPSPSRFPLTDDAEVAIEIDPCVTTMEHLEHPGPARLQPHLHGAAGHQPRGPTRGQAYPATGAHQRARRRSPPTRLHLGQHRSHLWSARSRPRRASETASVR